jgi:uncharacterized membrane protein
MIKKISLWLQVLLYLAAGINHFRVPEFYYPIIPDYLGHQSVINAAAGIAEIVLAIGLAFSATRKWAAYGIILLLLAFLPSHIYMITNHAPLPGWVLWARLLVGQPLLILWAWSVRHIK